jgi:uncharacterized protein
MKLSHSTPKKPSKDWRQALQDRIAEQAKPVDKFGHQPRLHRLTQDVGAGLTYDHDVVFAAAWLHDIGVFVGHRPADPAALARWDNVKYAMYEAPSILQDCGFPEEKIEAVIEAIRTHQAAAEPLSVEATVLRDADILEQLGAVGILRAVCKVGRDTRYATFTDVIPVLGSAMKTLPGKLKLERSRELAQERVMVLQAFLDGVEREGGEGLY